VENPRLWHSFAPVWRAEILAAELPLLAAVV
jgi:hypothetical protein